MTSKQKKSNIFKRNSIRFFGSVFSEGNSSGSNDADKNSNQPRGSSSTVGSSPHRRISMLSGNDTRSVKSTNTTNTSESSNKPALEVNVTALPAQTYSSVESGRNSVNVSSGTSKTIAKSTNFVDTKSKDSYNYKRLPPDSVSASMNTAVADSTIRNVNDTTNVYASQGIKGMGIGSQNIEISNTPNSRDLMQADDILNSIANSKGLKANHKSTKSEIEKLQDEVEDMILKSPYLDADEKGDLEVANLEGLPLTFSTGMDSDRQHLTPIDTNKPILPLNVSNENLAALRRLDEYAGDNDKNSLLFNEASVEDSDENDFKEVDTYENLIKQQEKLRAANKSHSDYHTPTETTDDFHKNIVPGANSNSYPHFFDENETSREEQKDQVGFHNEYSEAELQKSVQNVFKDRDAPETPIRDIDNWSIQDSPVYQKDHSYAGRDDQDLQVLQMTEAPLNLFKDEDDFVIQPSIHHIPTMKQDFNASYNDFYEDEDNVSHVIDTSNMIRNLLNHNQIPYDPRLSNSQNIHSNSHYELQDFEAANDSADQFSHSKKHDVDNSEHPNSHMSNDNDVDLPPQYGTSGLQIANPDSEEDDEDEDRYSYSAMGNNGSNLQVVNNDNSSENELTNSSAIQVAIGYPNEENKKTNSFIPPPEIVSNNNNEFVDGPYRRESIDLNSEVNNTNDDYYSQVDSNILPQQRQVSSRYSMAGTPHSNYFATYQQEISQGSFSHQYNNNNNKSENSSISSRPISSTNPFYNNYNLTDRLIVDSKCPDATNNGYSNYNEGSNITSDNNTDLSVLLSDKNTIYTNNSNSIRNSKYIPSVGSNKLNTSESRKATNNSSNLERDTSMSLTINSSKVLNEDKEKRKQKEIEMGKGIKSKYVETLRASTRLSNSQIGSRKWNLPLGIRTIDKRILERKSSQFSNSNQIKSLQKDIKHAALQLSMLAEEEEEEEEQEEEEAVKLGAPTIDNRRKSRFPGIGGDRNLEEVDSSENDDVDLFADFAEDIEKVNKKVQSPDPTVNMDSVIGSPDAANLQRFQSIDTVGYGVSQPLFIANPDSD